MVAEDRKKDKMSSLRAAFKSGKAGKTIQDGCRMEIYEKRNLWYYRHVMRGMLSANWKRNFRNGGHAAMQRQSAEKQHDGYLRWSRTGFRENYSSGRRHRLWRFASPDTGQQNDRSIRQRKKRCNRCGCGSSKADEAETDRFVSLYDPAVLHFDGTYGWLAAAVVAAGSKKSYDFCIYPVFAGAAGFDCRRTLF